MLVYFYLVMELITYQIGFRRIALSRELYPLAKLPNFVQDKVTRSCLALI